MCLAHLVGPCDVGVWHGVEHHGGEEDEWNVTATNRESTVTRHTRDILWNAASSSWLLRSLQDIDWFVIRHTDIMAITTRQHDRGVAADSTTQFSFLTAANTFLFDVVSREPKYSYTKAVLG